MLAYRDFILKAVPADYHQLICEENARVLFKV
jgi:hypothetical protein